jgi:hypothetical protein
MYSHPLRCCPHDWSCSRHIHPCCFCFCFFFNFARRLRRYVPEATNNFYGTTSWTGGQFDGCHQISRKLYSKIVPKAVRLSLGKCPRVTAVREARIDIRRLADDADCDHPDDDGDDGLSEDPEGPGEPLRIVNTTQELLTHIHPVAPLSGALRRHGNYFDLASSLKPSPYSLKSPPSCGEHITVDFLTNTGHVITQHVYTYCTHAGSDEILSRPMTSERDC